MKKAFLYVAAMLLCLAASAQTQQGYVKTKGRMVNGKLVPGQGLKGATVSIKGRTAVLVNTDDGAFSFPVTETQFQLDSVNKKGYQLVDLDACPKIYKYSTNPLYIVMETPEQQLQDKLAAERKIRRNLQKQLQEKENEIEALKDENKITMEEYQNALMQIYAEQENNEQLISNMAKRYAELDYDQLDEFYRQVSYCIENGELVKADSLLRSRGDINAQVHDIIQRGQTLTEQREQLEKAEAMQQADIEEAARRCYSFYETFLAQHLNDSAAYYIELRASLDTTNMQWQDDAGTFLLDFMSDIDKTKKYYEMSLRQAERNHDYDNLVNCYNNMAAMNMISGLFEEMQKNIDMALELINNGLCTKNSLIADTYGNIGTIDYFNGDFDKAIENNEKAHQIMLKFSCKDDADIATILNNLGFIYTCAAQFDKALECLGQALQMWKSMYGEEHPDVALVYSNTGNVYISKYYKGTDYNKALEYFQKALNIRKAFFGEMHPNVATSYASVGSAYELIGNYEQALEYSLKSKEINETLYGEDYYNLSIDNSQIGRIYTDMGVYDKAIEYLQKAININIANFGEDHPDVASEIISMGVAYQKKGECDKAIELHEKALEIRRRLFDENSVFVTELLSYLGADYCCKKDFNTALEYYQTYYDLLLSILGEDHPDTITAKQWVEYVKGQVNE